MQTETGQLLVTVDSESARILKSWPRRKSGTVLCEPKTKMELVVGSIERNHWLVLKWSGTPVNFAGKTDQRRDAAS
jgi:hypothetical protein